VRAPLGVARRLGRLLSVVLALPALTLPALLPASPASAEPGPVTIEGRIVNRTAGAAVPGGLDVTILQLGQDFTEHARRTVKAGPAGAFRAEGWDGRIANRFVASAEHLGIAYRASAEGDSGTLTTDITVFETTTDENALRVAADTAAVVTGADGVLEVLHILRVVNGTDRTFVGNTTSQPPAVLKLPVPAGAYDVTPQEGSGGSLAQFDGGIATADPLPPGDTTVSFLYRVKVPASGWALRRPVWYPTGKATVLAASGLTLDAAGFKYKGTVPLDERTYGRWERASIPPGTELAGRIGPDTAGSGLSWGLVAGLAALFVIVGTAGLLRRRRKRRVAASGGQGERLRLVEEIAALDDALEAGSVTRTEHAERRGVLKQRLVDLTGDG
jgi:LPXTG-motif cell wall-anchored protein